MSHFVTCLIKLHHFHVIHQKVTNYVFLYICLLMENYVKSKSAEKVRSSRPEVFCKKGVLRNFAKFTGKHLCQSLFFNEVTSLSPAILLKKRFWHRRFPVNLAKFLRTPFLTEHLRWLLLKRSEITILTTTHTHSYTQTQIY